MSVGGFGVSYIGASSLVFDFNVHGHCFRGEIILLFLFHAVIGGLQVAFYIGLPIAMLITGTHAITCLFEVREHMIVTDSVRVSLYL